MYKALKLKWAKRLLQARYFVILTDKESVIALDGVDPSAFDDRVALQSQSAAISEFVSRLKDLQKLHADAIKTLTGGKDAAINRKTTTAKSKAKKG